jgi:hypothetical protein
LAHRAATPSCVAPRRRHEIHLTDRRVAGLGRARAGTRWTAFIAIAEQLDYGRRYTSPTNQVQRSFEDNSPKQRALELIAAP